jgi:hypothetical protein
MKHSQSQYLPDASKSLPESLKFLVAGNMKSPTVLRYRVTVLAVSLDYRKPAIRQVPRPVFSSLTPFLPYVGVRSGWFRSQPERDHFAAAHVIRVIAYDAARVEIDTAEKTDSSVANVGHHYAA